MKMELSIVLLLYNQLVNDKFLDLCKEFGSVVSVSFELDWLGKVEAEDTHNGLSIDCISAGNKVNIVVAERNCCNKILDIIDCT